MNNVKTSNWINVWDTFPRFYGDVAANFHSLYFLFVDLVFCHEKEEAQIIILLMWQNDRWAVQLNFHRFDDNKNLMVFKYTQWASDRETAHTQYTLGFVWVVGILPGLFFPCPIHCYFAVYSLSSSSMLPVLWSNFTKSLQVSYFLAHKVSSAVKKFFL